MKNKYFIIIAAIITGLLIGIVSKTRIDYEEPKSIYELEDLGSKLKMVKSQVSVNDEIISGLNQKVSALKFYTNKEEYKNSLNLELQNFKKISASTDVKGEGIVIKMSDSKDKILKNTNFGIVHDIDIINILNELKIYGAEAISINDVRIVENSVVKCGGAVVRIDDIPKSVPFIIKAIGDKEKLYAGLYDTSGYLKILKDVYKVEIEVEQKGKIFIPKRVS